MKKALILMLAAACASGAWARSLNVVTASATYSFVSTSMGDAVMLDPSNVQILGRTFPVSDIQQMVVVEEDMADNTVSVTYSGSKATVMVAGNVAQYVDAIVDGAHVTLTQSDLVGDATCGEITYSLAGASTNGSFSLYGTYKSSIALRGLTLTNPYGAAIDIQNGKRIELSIKSETTNSLTDGADGSQKAALYCKGHLELKGNGALTVAGKTGHAIAAKEYITLKNCTITVTEAVKDGINCQQYFQMASGTVSISGIGDDAIQVDYKDETNREAEDTGSISIEGGTITATVTNRASKALKADGCINVSGGELNLTVTGGGMWDSTDSKTKASSCLNSDENVTISGGKLSLTATGSGGKGVSCDGTFLLNGGEVTINTSGGAFVYYNNKEYDGTYTGSLDNINSDRKSSAKGVKADTKVQIDNGTIYVNTKGKNAEGIESKGELVINGGVVRVKAYDDGINSSSYMRINGGDIIAIASNNDGLDSNGNMYINGGTIMAFGSSAPECGIDANEEGGYTVVFTGGTLMGIGGNNSVPSSSSSSTQAYVSASKTVTAGTVVQLLNGSTVLAEFTVPTQYGSSSSYFAPSEAGPGGGGWPGGGTSGGGLIITCPGLTSGSSYTLKVGTASSSVTAKK